MNILIVLRNRRLKQVFLSMKVDCWSGDMAIIKSSSRSRMCYLRSSNKEITSELDEEGLVADFLGWIVKGEINMD